LRTVYTPPVIDNRLTRAIRAHVASRQVGRVIYGSIIGLALVVALESHPPRSGVVAGLLIGTALAVALAEIYSEVVGGEVRHQARLPRAELRQIAVDGVAVALGVAFPAVFFLLDALRVIEPQTAFTLAKWSGIGLIGFYGFCAGRLAGASVSASLLQAFAVCLIGAMLIALKAVLH
jgi:hypothetical protein